jgi:molecular chaperone GrpE (heat shock protein)
MKTIDLKLAELCDEIDFWKAEAKHYKERFENLRNEMIKDSRERLEESQKGIANALMFALSVKDDGDGNLVVSKDDRKKLAKNWNK